MSTKLYVALLGFVLIVSGFFVSPDHLLGGTPEGDELTEMGEGYYGLRRFVDALGVLKKAVRVDPRNDKALYLLGMIYRDTNNFENADSCFRRALRYNSKNTLARDELVQLHYNLAKQYANDGNVNDAIKELKIIASFNVFSLDSIVFLMTLYDTKKNYQGIIELCETLEQNSAKAIGDENQWGTIYYYGGMAAYKEKSYGKAEKWFASSMRSTSEHPAARGAYEQVRLIQKKKLLPILKKGDSLARRGNYEEALNTYKVALTIDRNNNTLQSRIDKVGSLQTAQKLLETARKFENDGQWVKAYELLEKASQHSPGDPDILGRLQRVEKILVELQQKQERDQLLRERADQKKQSKIKSLYDKAEYALARNKYIEAIAYYEQLLKLSPDDRTVKLKIQRCYKAAKTVELFVTAKSKFDRKDFSGALADFMSLKEEDPYYKGLPMFIAKCYIGMDSFTEAEKALKNILDGESDNREALMLLADLYYSQIDANSGNLGRALTLYTILMQFNPDDQKVTDRISDLSWRLHKMKYFFIIFLLLASVAAYAYIRVRPALLRKSLLRSLERYAASENWDKIRSMYQNVGEMKFTPLEEAQARYIFAKGFYERGFYKQALKECQELMRLKRITKRGRLLLARVYYGTKTISPEVLDLYMELLTEERTDIKLRNFIADFCASKKIINPTTLPLLRQFAVDSPENSQLRTLLVKACIKTKDRGSAAMSLFKLEAEKNPENVDVRAIMADELMKSDKLEEAVSECEQIINISLNHRHTHDVLLAAYEKMDKLSDLAATYQSILEHDPHNAVINHYLRKILHPDGSDDRKGADEVAGLNAPNDWMEQMPAGLKVESDKDTASKVEKLDEPSNGPLTGAMPCKKCGRPVPIGSYFCECGHPL